MVTDPDMSQYLQSQSQLEHVGNCLTFPGEAPSEISLDLFLN